MLGGRGSRLLLPGHMCGRQVIDSSTPDAACPNVLSLLLLLLPSSLPLLPTTQQPSSSLDEGMQRAHDWVRNCLERVTASALRYMCHVSPHLPKLDVPEVATTRAAGALKPPTMHMVRCSGTCVCVGGACVHVRVHRIPFQAARQAGGLIPY